MGFLGLFGGGNKDKELTDKEIEEIQRRGTEQARAEMRFTPQQTQEATRGLQAQPATLNDDDALIQSVTQGVRGDTQRMGAQARPMFQEQLSPSQSPYPAVGGARDMFASSMQAPPVAPTPSFQQPADEDSFGQRFRRFRMSNRGY